MPEFFICSYPIRSVSAVCFRLAVLLIPAFSNAVLSESADFLYKTTDYYSPEHERALAWNDPQVAVAWPFDDAPTLSAKDGAAPLLRELAPGDLFP